MHDGSDQIGAPAPRWVEVDHRAPGWQAAVDALWARLLPTGAPLLPDYFVKTTFVKMGGRLLELRAGPDLLAVGQLFPRGLEGGARRYALRLHALGPLPPDEALLAALAPDRATLYRPEEARGFAATHATVGAFDLGAPAAEEMSEVRAIYASIWGAGDAGYPDDLYSAELGPATALVARRDGKVAGFLLGFHRFGGLDSVAALGAPHRVDLCVESQVMGVAHAFRRFGLAATLKRAQAREALARGMNVIHWTADPLQFANAALNFGRLRAVAGAVYPAYYPFRNELNRVAASRLGVTWLLGSARGRAGLEGSAPAHRELADFPGAAVLNDGPRRLRDADGAPYIALEIPADWTALQRDEPGLAEEWRAVSDRLLLEHLGFAPGRYLVVDAAVAGGRRFLVAERFSERLVAP